MDANSVSLARLRRNARANHTTIVLSYNPIVTTTLNRSVGVKALKYGGVERAPFLGVYESHISYAFNECSKVNKNDGISSGQAKGRDPVYKSILLLFYFLAAFFP